MDITKILSIAGRPGLYKHVAQSRKGIVIESLTDGVNSTAFPSENVSSLQDIAIFTVGEDKPLYEVFQAIFKKENGGKTISHKSSSKELKEYFKEVLPEYDEDRVYVSNIKRILQWYNILQAQGLIDLEKPKSKNEDENKDENQNENEDKNQDNNKVDDTPKEEA